MPVISARLRRPRKAAKTKKKVKKKVSKSKTVSVSKIPLKGYIIIDTELLYDVYSVSDMISLLLPSTVYFSRQAAEDSIIQESLTRLRECTNLYEFAPGLAYRISQKTYAAVFKDTPLRDGEHLTEYVIPRAMTDEQARTVIRLVRNATNALYGNNSDRMIREINLDPGVPRNRPKAKKAKTETTETRAILRLNDTKL